MSHQQSKKVLTAPIFLYLRNSETERETSPMHTINSLDLQEIFQVGPSCFFVSLSIPKLQRFGIVGAINTFETASTSRMF